MCKFHRVTKNELRQEYQIALKNGYKGTYKEYLTQQNKYCDKLLAILNKKKGGNDMTNLTELQSKFINCIPKEGVDKKEFLNYLQDTGTMNKMQAGACITTLRKKGYIKFDDKRIELLHGESESNVLQFIKQDEETPTPKKRRGRPKKSV